MKQVGVEIPKVDALEKVLGETRYGADLSIKDPLISRSSGAQNPMPRF